MVWRKSALERRRRRAAGTKKFHDVSVIVQFVGRQWELVLRLHGPWAVGRGPRVVHRANVGGGRKGPGEEGEILLYKGRGCDRKIEADALKEFPSSQNGLKKIKK